jgi:mercuric ion transport protein
MNAQKPSNAGTNWSLCAALGAALAASACCTIPLALVSLGIGGAWIRGLTALEPYRWLFVLFAAGALGYAGYNEWQMSRRPDCDCETIFSSTTRRTLLGAGALTVVALVARPWLIASSPSETTQQAHRAATTTEPPEAVVRFDPKNTSVQALTRATTRAGFPSHPKSTSDTPPS